MNILSVFYFFSGYFAVSSSTIARAFATPSSPSLMTMEIASAILSISSVFMPLDVTDGVPRRIPLVTNGDFGSFGIVFLLPEIFGMLRWESLRQILLIISTNF